MYFLVKKTKLQVLIACKLHVAKIVYLKICIIVLKYLQHNNLYNLPQNNLKLEYWLNLPPIEFKN